MKKTKYKFINIFISIFQDFGDGSSIKKDWSLVYGVVCKVINQKRRNSL